MRLDRAGEEHVRELMQGAELARDQLPYTEEFDRLKQGFYMRTFKKVSDAEFWLILARVGKKGGVRGKATQDHAPELSDDQKATLLKRLPVAIGETDSLPYTERMSRLVKGFNAAVNLSLSEREVWLAVLDLRK
jgi:hypothetical protein